PWQSTGQGSTAPGSRHTCSSRLASSTSWYGRSGKSRLASRPDPFRYPGKCAGLRYGAFSSAPGALVGSGLTYLRATTSSSHQDAPGGTIIFPNPKLPDGSSVCPDAVVCSVPLTNR